MSGHVRLWCNTTARTEPLGANVMGCHMRCPRSRVALATAERHISIVRAIYGDVIPVVVGVANQKSGIPIAESGSIPDQLDHKGVLATGRSHWPLRGEVGRVRG